MVQAPAKHQAMLALLSEYLRGTAAIGGGDGGKGAKGWERRRRRRRECEQEYFFTFGVVPVGVEVWQGGLVADLFERLWGLVINLEDTARPPTSAAFISVGHV